MQLIAISHERLCVAIEHLTERVKEKVYDTEEKYIQDFYIPKSKIKEKIEEYKQEADEETNLEAFSKIDTLKELLEEEK